MMVTRKSPIQHRVKTHKRQGNPIQSFERGHGQRPQRPGGGIVVGKNPSTQSPETTYPPITCPECGHVFPGTYKDYLFRIAFCPKCGKMIKLESIGLPEEAEWEIRKEYRKILKLFLDRELRAAKVYDDRGYDAGGYVESVTTGKRYSWGDNWTTGFTLSATRMAKYLYKAGLLPDTKLDDRTKLQTAKSSVLKWMKDKLDVG